jgi:uncharacterized protein (TIGR00304 family)
MVDQALWNMGVALVLFGLTLTIDAVLWMVLSSTRGTSKGKASGGGVIVIGPVPIIFGTDKESLIIVLVLSITLVILLLLITVFWSECCGRYETRCWYS